MLNPVGAPQKEPRLGEKVLEENLHLMEVVHLGHVLRGEVLRKQGISLGIVEPRTIEFESHVVAARAL